MKKTISFGILHMMVAFTVGYAFTGSWMVGGLMAIVEPMINTVVFYFRKRPRPEGRSFCFSRSQN